MSKKRIFDKLNENQKIEILFHSLSAAFKELVWDNDIKRRTTIYGIALQYITRYRVKKEDYNLIKNMTIDEIVNSLDKQKK